MELEDSPQVNQGRKPVRLRRNIFGREKDQAGLLAGESQAAESDRKRSESPMADQNAITVESERKQEEDASASRLRDLREARRRKILSRGADRLAFITGDKNALTATPTLCAAADEPSSVTPARLSPEFEPPAGGFDPGMPDSTRPQRRSSGTGTTSRESFHSASPLLNGIRNERESPVRERKRGDHRDQGSTGPSDRQFGTDSAAPLPARPDSPLRLLREALTAELPTQSGQTQLPHPFLAPGVTSPFVFPSSSAQAASQEGDGGARGLQPRGATAVPAVSAAVDITQGLRLSLALLMGALVCAQVFLRACNSPAAQALQRLIPPWPIIFFVVTDVTTVVGAYFWSAQRTRASSAPEAKVARLTKPGPSPDSRSESSDDRAGRPTPKTPPRDPGPVLGLGIGLGSRVQRRVEPERRPSQEADQMDQLLRMVSRVGEGIQRGMLALKIVRGLVLDISIFAVVVCCGVSVGTWLLPACPL